MSILVRIPAPLRKITSGQSEVKSNGATLKELIVNLDSAFPGFHERVADDRGKIHPFINLYINDEDARYLKDLESPLRDGDRVSIVPAIAGG